MNKKEIDITKFGKYKDGLTSAEINKYLRMRTKKKNIRTQFNDAAGCNTCAIGPDGQRLMYRWDVQRFADVVLLNKPTYFD